MLRRLWHAVVGHDFQIYVDRTRRGFEVRIECSCGTKP